MVVNWVLSLKNGFEYFGLVIAFVKDKAFVISQYNIRKKKVIAKEKQNDSL